MTEQEEKEKLFKEVDKIFKDYIGTGLDFYVMCELVHERKKEIEEMLYKKYHTYESKKPSEL